MSKSKRIRLQRQRQARFGDLDQLLKDALYAKPVGEGSVRHIRLVSQSLHDQFTNPQNWEDRGVLLLVYVDETTGESTTVGTFQEKVFKPTGARRLVRVEVDTAPRREIVHDPYLVRPKVDPAPPSPPANEFEKAAIRAYLARTKEQKLDEFLGSKVDAGRLLGELRSLGVEL